MGDKEVEQNDDIVVENEQEEEQGEEQDEVKDEDVEKTEEEEDENETTQDPGQQLEESPAQNAAMKNIEKEYIDRMTVIETERLKLNAELDKESKGHKEEIQVLFQRDRERLEMQEALAKMQSDNDELDADITAVTDLKKNKDAKLSMLMNDKAAREKRLGKVINNIEAGFKEKFVLADNKKKFEEEKENATSVISKQYYRFRLYNTEKDIEKLEKNMKSWQEESEKLPGEIATINNQIEQLNAEISQMTQHLNDKIALKAESDARLKQSQSEYEERDKQDKKQEPKWYKEYMTKRAKYVQYTNKLQALAAEKDEVSNNLKDSQIDDKADTKVVIEEAKVEAALRKSPAIQEVNATSINEMLNYNPDTGESYQEGEEKKTSNLLVDNVGKLLSDENIKTIKDGAASLRDATFVKLIDMILTAPIPGYTVAVGLNFAKPPLQSLLDLIANADFEAARKAVIEFVEKYSSNDFRAESPVLYGLCEIIFPALGDAINIGNKGDVSLGKRFDNWVGNKIYGLGGSTAGAIVETISGFATMENILPLISKGILKLAVKSNRVTKAISNIVSSVKNGVLAVKNFTYDTHQIKKYIKAEEKSSKESNPEKDRYLRMLKGAKNGIKRSGASHVVNFVGDAGKAFCDATLGAGVSIATNMAISGLEGGVSAGIGSLIEKSHKSDVLESPEVLGNVKYNEKLVNEDRFNQILKKVSGITSKDKLYNAIKTFDSVKLHAAMRKSYVNEDKNTDYVLAGLGFKDRSCYPNVSVYDIMKASGHTPSGGDWRRELSDSLLEEGKDYKTLMGGVGGHIKNYIVDKHGWTNLLMPIPGLNLIGMGAEYYYYRQDAKKNEAAQSLAIA
jgi:hypothetical protein